MQFLLLIYEDEKHYAGSRNGSDMSELGAKHMAFGAEIGAKRLAGAGLKTTDMATTVRTAGGKKTVHDGPFAETKEQLGGYYLIEAASLDDAIAIAKKVPLLKEGSVEVRPLMTMGPPPK